MVRLSQDSGYQVAGVFPATGITLYEPKADTDYHMSRYVAANAQNIFSQSGATREVLAKIVDRVLDLCNETADTKRLRTDVGLLMNNIKTRLAYPVDEDCSIRLGAIFYFLEDEDPSRVDDEVINRKVMLAKTDPDLYAFFLSRGLVNTPAYSTWLDLLEDKDYFKRRMETLLAVTPREILSTLPHLTESGQ